MAKATKDRKESDPKETEHGGHVLERLGRSVVRRPWHYLGFWIAITLVCMFAVVNLSSIFVNTSSFSLPSSDASVVAQNELAKEFPSASASGSSSIVLLVGNDMTGRVAQNATWAITQAIQSDPKIKYLGSVETLYTAYGGELYAQSEVGLGVLGYALASTPSFPTELNETAQMVWSPAATYVQVWAEVASALPHGANLSMANWPAYVETRSYLNSSQIEEQILSTFFLGNSGVVPGFNQTVTTACMQSYNVTPCAETSMRTTFPTIIPALFPNATEQALPFLMVNQLGILNMSNWNDVKWIGVTLLGEEAGLPASFMLTLWDTFPKGTASASAVMDWSMGLTEQLPISQFPLPVSPALMSAFVSKGDTATMLVVSFTKPDNYTEGGGTPVYQDLDQINIDVPNALHSSPSYSGIVYYQTGDAPFDHAISTALNSILGTLLVITVVLLTVAMMLYFRSPAAPLVTFAGIGISMVVTLACLFVVSTYVVPIIYALESILLIFLMAIVTDYSIFMMARYREELTAGRSSHEAVAISVRWAGQSIITSGLTVFAAGIAMSLSGLSFLKMFGIALSVAVVISILMAIMVIPAVLTLVGPKIFWPYVGDRFRNHAEKRQKDLRADKTYFSQAGKLVTSHPAAVIIVILLISVPVVIVAMGVPVSYDVTNLGLPSSDSTQKGLSVLEQQFGGSTTSPSYVLVTFSQPLFTNSSVNAKELADVQSIANIINSTSGISHESSLVGPGGAPLSTWLNYSYLPPWPKTALMIDQQTYLGIDGRTVEIQIATNASGYSGAGGDAFNSIHTSVGSFQSTHPEVASVYYGGAGQTTLDSKALTNYLTEWMLIGVAVAIFVVLLAILGTAIVPLLAIAAICLSIVWAWTVIYYVVNVMEGIPLLFFIPLVLIVLVLGLGMDYNALLLTRVKEERLKGRSSSEAIKRSVTHVGGVVTAAALILGGPFLVLGLLTSVGVIAAIGLGIGIATILQSFVAQTYLIPAILAIGKDKVWWGIGSGRSGGSGKTKTEAPSEPTDETDKDVSP
jgi:RND superfamily putative drug exporter